MQNCILYDNRECIQCGECDRCDLDLNKICDNCCKCIESDADFVAVEVDDIVIDDE